MTPFTYSAPATVQEALQAYGQAKNPRFIGGGTNLLDLMKMGVEQPAEIIDINQLPLKQIEERNGGLRIGALVSNTDAANHPLVRSRYPVLSRAILSGASQQLRNMATMGGNLLQRTRCYYFYDPTFQECNKRNPGSGCGALHGFNRIHAILGQSPECIAVNPSDMSVALAALDAVVQVRGPKSEREIPVVEFHRLPGKTPNIDTNLRPGELITAIDLPAISFGRNSCYLKIRDRQSYAFALVSVAALADVEPGGTVREARIALGGVALKPWRARRAEAALKGRKLNDETLRAAADSELRDAHGYEHNEFKIELAKRAIRRAVKLAAAQQS
ncbi:MAG: xanthine dehydrogenase family protein subunit M [Acidobacteriaceae bacterium]|nr:xanthine dehydrogenase family protein subunit M [Acidobacteriaceae bacterium]